MDYEFYWFIGNSAPPLPNGGPGDVNFAAADHSGNGAAGSVWNNRPAGEYTIVARYAPDQCQSVPKTVKVIDIAKPPVVTEISNIANSLCTTPGNGLLEIQASKAPANFNYPGDTTINNGYIYAWSGGATGSLRNGLSDGDYTVTVTDDETKCFTTTTFTVGNNKELPNITAVATVSQQDCGPAAGSVEVTNMTSGGTIVPAANMASDYDFHWYNDISSFSASNLPNGRIAYGGAGTATNTLLANLNPAVYYVVAQDTATGCTSFPIDGRVRDEKPEIEIYLTAKDDFTTCTGVNEGFIEIRIDGPTTPPYTISWYEGSNNITGTASITATTSRINDLQDGVYTILVQDNVGAGNSQCADSAFFTLNQRVRKPILVASKISDQMSCLPNGGISVDAITLGGGTENFNDYDFTWYQGSLDASGQGNFVAGAHTFTAIDSLQLTPLPADVFFVTATKVNPGGMIGCTTEPYQIIIEDKSVPLVVILDDISDPITGCDPSNKAEGEIEIDVRNSSGYTVQWFSGTSANPANQLVAFNDEDEIEDLIPGYYTVMVADPATGCDATRIYEIIGIPVPVAVATSASPFNSCMNPNGIIAANANGGSGVYNYRWHAGTDTSSVRLSVPNTQSLVENLSNGTYTVVVTDRNEPGCRPAVAEAVVRDERGRDVMITIATDFPVTNCDESNPNGQLSASIDGTMSQYNFFWYEGTNTAANPIARGAILANVPAAEYTVVVRDRITGCLSSPFSATPEEGEMILPPLAEVIAIAQQTHCLVPNGAARASLDAASLDPNVDYIYTWYANDNASGQPFFFSSRTNEAHGLDEGDFSVTVTNALTGCISEPALFAIEEILKIS